MHEAGKDSGRNGVSCRGSRPVVTRRRTGWRWSTPPVLPLLRAAAVLLLLAGTAQAAESVIGHMAVYRATKEDTLLDIARRFNLGFVELRVANPDMDVWLPGEGMRVLLPTAHLLPDVPHKGLVINLPEMRLYYFAKDGTQIYTYPIGVARDGRLTPIGKTSVVRKKPDPTWYPPASIRAEKPDLPRMVPPGPDNPLGSHALYLGWPAYLVHGTNKPWGVGRRVSSGCIRLYPEDILDLYPKVPVGTPVTVIDQPVKVGWVGDALYVEVHPSLAQADQIEQTGHFDPEIPENIVGTVLAAAGTQSNRIDWDVVRRAGIERRGYPIRITR